MIYHTSVLRAFTVTVIFLPAASLTYAAQQYRIDFIEAPSTVDPNQYLQAVVGLNNLGEVAFGYNRTVETPTHLRVVTDSFVATQAGNQAVPDLGGDDVQVLDLTDNGLIVGGAASADTYRPSRWPEYEWHYLEPFVSQAGHIKVIPTPARGFSVARAANNDGVVVGSAPSSSTGGSVFQWSESAGYVDLGDFGAEYVDVVDINERGDILLTLHSDEVRQYGETYLYKGRDVVVYSGGAITSVPPSEYGLTFASAINDNRAVVGQFHSIPGVEAHAYIWDERRGFRDIGSDGDLATPLA